MQMQWQRSAWISIWNPTRVSYYKTRSMQENIQWNLWLNKWFICTTNSVPPVWNVTTHHFMSPMNPLNMLVNGQFQWSYINVQSHTILGYESMACWYCGRTAESSKSYMSISFIYVDCMFLGSFTFSQPLPHERISLSSLENATCSDRWKEQSLSKCVLHT